ncbi:DUF5522 domain-containing protein [Foetidibacter luteolus]|uniref:DUF5522 domain-containing protein n=1 Tax=Foetidibacter luteolus TaxID=2608880 RepID=UPI001F4286A9|nr:DUF5522 domain-containing protein [Foetidibacter luteolus]
MSQPMIENRDYYFNKEGLMVMTAAWHLRRGYCCGNGCLHCPYDYEKVPEPKKSHLLQAREDKPSP